MNKLFKYLLVGIATFSVLFASFSNALTLNNVDYDWQFRFNLQSVNWNVDLSPTAPWITCVNLDRASGWTFYDWTNTYTFSNWNTYCTDSMIVQINTNWYYAYYWYFFWDNFIKEFYPDMTSLQCQTEYNLIPISDVTANYCKINFNLISPSECPISEWTGAVNRSSLFINNTQYPWNSTISIWIPDYIWRSITYNDDENIVDIEWYNADEEYINNVIDNEKLTPTNSDFENMLTWLVNFFPYLAIAILFYFLIKVVYKIFK